MKTDLYTSLGLSTLFNFYQKNKVPLNELEKLESQFEKTGEANGSPLWTPKIGRTEAEIRFFNIVLMEWVWNFRDFFLLYAKKNLGLSETAARAATKAVIAQSDALKLCGYFRNRQSHGEVTIFDQYPAFKTTPPSMGEVQVHHVADNGDTVYKTNHTGAEWAAVSTQLPFIQTVAILDFPGERDTRRIAEEAAWEWIGLLKNNGCDLKVTKPQGFKKDVIIDTFVFGATPKAQAARYIPYPEGLDAVPVEWNHLDNYGVYLFGSF
ncbi:MAG: hypothetical protein JSR77_18605 [Planctomycetes bacterium]|nr:hypothetical protein [Planctomycetota bacterium]